MYNPLISAIITTHNRLDLLKRAVESVFAQSYPNIELIVVDDGSTDGTEEWSRTQNKIRYLRIPKGESKGGNYARNLGIKNSTGQYVAFLDDDDYWLPNKIEEQVKVATETQNKVVYGGRRLEIIDSRGQISYKDELPNPRYQGDLSKKVLTSSFTTTSLILVERELLLKVGLFDEDLRFWQDYELLIRLAQCAKFAYVNKIITVYRLDTTDSNRLTNRFTEWRKSVSYIKEKHRELYKNQSLWQKVGIWVFLNGDTRNRAKSAGLKKKYFSLSLAKPIIWTYRGIKMIRILTGCEK